MAVGISSIRESPGKKPRMKGFAHMKRYGQAKMRTQVSLGSSRNHQARRGSQTDTRKMCSSQTASHLVFAVLTATASRETMASHEAGPNSPESRQSRPRKGWRKAGQRRYSQPVLLFWLLQLTSDAVAAAARRLSADCTYMPGSGSWQPGLCLPKSALVASFRPACGFPTPAPCHSDDFPPIDFGTLLPQNLILPSASQGIPSSTSHCAGSQLVPTNVPELLTTQASNSGPAARQRRSQLRRHTQEPCGASGGPLFSDLPWPFLLTLVSCRPSTTSFIILDRLERGV